MLDQVSRTNWYPYRLVAEMNRGIYLAGGGDEAGYTATVSAGAAAAKDATQTFLRLLIKLMTPEIMARKWPTVWKRSHNFGTMDTKLDPGVERRLLMRLGDVEGYDYIAPVAVGFLTYSLQAMGLPQASVLQRGDRSVPAASAVEFEVTW